MKTKTSRQASQFWFIVLVRSKFIAVPLVETGWLLSRRIPLLLRVSIQRFIFTIIPLIWTRRGHLNASRLRSQYLIKTSKRLCLFRWQHKHSCLHGISANEGEEIKKHFKWGRRFEMQSNLLTIKNSDHTHHLFKLDFATSRRPHKHRNILTISICKGKQGRRIEDQHQVTYRIIMYSLEGAN